MDVKNAFLHGTLAKTVYCSQPLGFTDLAHPDYVYRLNKSLWLETGAPGMVQPICKLHVESGFY